MVNANTQRWSAIERLCPTAFLVGGSGLFLLSVLGGLHVAAVVSSPGWLLMGLLLGGLWFVFLGLFGFYPTIAEPAPRLSLGGVVTSTIGGFALSVGIAAAIVVSRTTRRTFAEGPAWGPPLLAAAFILVLLSFLFYGAASLRTAVPSRPIGLLLLVPVVAFLGQSFLLITKIVGDEVSGPAQLTLAGITAIALLAVGYLLRTSVIPTDHTGPVPDTPIK